MTLGNIYKGIYGKAFLHEVKICKQVSTVFHLIYVVDSPFFLQGKIYKGQAYYCGVSKSFKLTSKFSSVRSFLQLNYTYF